MANYIAAAEAIQKAFVPGGHRASLRVGRTVPADTRHCPAPSMCMFKIVRDEKNNIVAEVEEMRDGPTAPRSPAARW